MKRAWILLLLLASAWLLSACDSSMFQLTREETPVVQEVAPTPTPTPFYYVVKQGDTLWKISKKVGVEMDILAKVNELSDPDLLRPGDRLLISDKVTISGEPLPTPTPTPIPCRQGCSQPPAGCVVKGYRARLDGMKLYVLPGDEIYAMQRGETWFCREQDAIAAGWAHWTPQGPETP